METTGQLVSYFSSSAWKRGWSRGGVQHGVEAHQMWVVSCAARPVQAEPLRIFANPSVEKMHTSKSSCCHRPDKPHLP